MEYTRFEIARVLGARALQLAMGAPPLVEPKGDISPLMLAELELAAKKCPITVLKK